MTVQVAQFSRGGSGESDRDGRAGDQPHERAGTGAQVVRYRRTAHRKDRDGAGNPQGAEQHRPRDQPAEPTRSTLEVVRRIRGAGHLFTEPAGASDQQRPREHRFLVDPRCLDRHRCGGIDIWIRPLGNLGFGWPVGTHHPERLRPGEVRTPSERTLRDRTVHRVGAAATCGGWGTPRTADHPNAVDGRAPR